MISRSRWLWALLPMLMVSACTKVPESEPVAEEPDADGATTYALCAPIPADHLDQWKTMIDEMKAKHDVHEASNAGVGIDRELVWLQETPQGAAAVVYFEGDDLEGMMARRDASQDDHTQWFVSQITAIHHLPEDLGQMPANEMVFQGDVGGIEGELQPYALAVPILPGKEQTHAAMIAELEGARHAAWEESRRSRGMAKEYVWNQKAPDGSIMTVVYLEITDPANLSLPPSTEFERWFREQVRDIHGIPVDAPMPANTLMASF